MENLRANLESLLAEQNPDRGRVCDRCGMRDGHNLTYCYRCPGRYVDFRETWADSIRRNAGNPYWLSNRLECLAWAYKKQFCRRREYAGLDAARAEFDRIALEICGAEEKGVKP